MSLTINYCFLLVVVIASVTGVQIEATTLAGICPDETLEGPTNVCYKFMSDQKNFFEAESSCNSVGGNLAVVDSGFTGTFLTNHAGSLNSSDFWIGATLYSVNLYKLWLWTDSYKFTTYTDWANGQPSGGETGGGQCASASVLDGTWSAADCSLTKFYVCQLPRIIYNCPSEWVYFEKSKSCYKVFFWANWHDAENACINNGSHLASIHSDAENNYVISISRDGNSHSDAWNQSTWIGSFTTTDDNSVYQWSDGSPVNYTHWAVTEPDKPGIQKCVVLWYDFQNVTYNNHWDNVECEMSMRNYVCKKPATVLNLN